MDVGLVDAGLAFGAGLASVLSPCVLPVVPIVITGTEKDSRWRPVAVVGGLALAFVAMGVLSALFGSVLLRHMGWIEKLAGVLIALFGVLMLADINVFKGLTIFNKVFNKVPGVTRGGLLGALLMGASLGLVWIPCVGPMLSSVLAMVATSGEVLAGVALLLVYSLGFSVPMLGLAYGSQWLRKRLGAMAGTPVAVRVFSGVVLLALGAWVFFEGAVVTF